MKQIKFLIAIALVSVIAISCKETKKEGVKDAIESVEAATETVIEGAEAATETVKEGLDEVAEAAKKKADSLKAIADKAVKKVVVPVKKVKKVIEGGC